MNVFWNKINCRQFDLAVITFLCYIYTRKSTPRQIYDEETSWDPQFFAGSGIKIPIAFGIRDQNFG